MYKSIYDACFKICENKSLKNIVDLGARHGEGYELFGKYHPEASYTFVEPSNRCIPKIKKIIDDNFSKNLNLIHGVLGLKDEETNFYQFPNDNDNSGNIISGRTEGKLEYKIKIYDYRKIFTHIEFLKCNIEGAEFDLIEQGFFDIVDYFVLEAHNSYVPNKNYLNIIDSLKDKFELTLWGNPNHRYCFINGSKK